MKEEREKEVSKGVLRLLFLKSDVHTSSLGCPAQPCNGDKN